MSYVTSLAIAHPDNFFSQQQIAGFMVKAMALHDDDARKLRALFRATGIETRASVLADYGRDEGFQFFPDNELLDPFPTTRTRMALYRTEALALSLQSATKCLEQKSVETSEITDLIVVSCTGMYAPGLDIDLVNALGLPSSTRRTCVNFMGCYAAFNALKLANAICDSNTFAKVLVVCTELCSIHFQKENTEDNFLANALFADGSAALLVESTPRQGVNLNPISFYNDLFTEGKNEMAWGVGDQGFEMRLSTYVPEIIRNGIHALTTKLLRQSQLTLDAVDYYAVHPGGKKILEVIEEALHLDKAANRPAYAVLKKFGNMSSPTVLFVLHEILSGLTPEDHEKKILSCAFGPGLTLESALFQIEMH